MKLLAKLLILFIVCLFLVMNSRVTFILSSILGTVARYLHIDTNFEVYRDESTGVVPYQADTYKYLINDESLCSKSDIFLVIFVKTHPDHVDRRKAIRETWGKLDNWENPKMKGDKKFAVLFMLGISSHDDASKERLLEESVLHGDIVQDSFKENFYNLTVKLVSQYKWMTHYCQSAKFFMTTDDDVFVHTRNLIRYLNEEVKSSNDVFIGHLHAGSPPFRDRSIKYHVPSTMYRGLYYPDYCAGAGYVLSLDVLQKLYACACKKPLLYIDDVFSGILAHSAQVQPVNASPFLGEGKVPDDPCYFSHFVTSHSYTPDAMRKFFRRLETTNAGDGSFCWWKV